MKAIIKRGFRRIPTAVFGLLSVIVCSFFILSSYLNFSGYNIINNDVSVLGIGPGIAALFFNLGIILTGILLFVFYLSLRYRLIEEDTIRGYLKRGNKSSLISSVSLSLIGCFPVINFTIGLIHALLALVFFVFCCLCLISYGLIFHKLDYISNFHANLSFCVAGIIIFYIITRWSIVEWIVFFSYGIWIIDVSIFTLKNEPN